MTDAALPSFVPLRVSGKTFHVIDLRQVGFGGNSAHPRTHNILAENLLSNGSAVQGLLDMAGGNGAREPEITFRPQRLIMQDYAGLPALLDLAALRSDAADLGLDPGIVSPELPVALAIDHSIVTMATGSQRARQKNEEHEFAQNAERFQFLKWAQTAFSSVRIIPPGKGILHQINLEHLCSGVVTKPDQGRTLVVADSLLGTDSHSTMVGGIGMLGWGIGGIEATACLLGHGVSLRWPKVVGVRLLNGKGGGVLTSDIALALTRKLRSVGVTDRFVEFFGPGVRSLAVSDRATIANMAPEYGATVAFFPTDERTLDYFSLTGRDRDQLTLIQAHAEEQGYWQGAGTADPDFETVIEIDLSAIGTTIAGPNRPEQALAPAKVAAEFDGPEKPGRQETGPEPSDLRNGDIVLAAITSCTNTANPEAIITAGLVAKRAVELGLSVSTNIKTSFAPGSQVVQRYLQASGLLAHLEALGFAIAGFGCMTCVGNSGPLDSTVQKMITEGDLNVCAVLSGNRNFESRIHKSIRSSFLMSPPLVIAAALAGHLRLDLEKDVLTTTPGGDPVRLRDLWPDPDLVADLLNRHVRQRDFNEIYGAIDRGSAAWRRLPAPSGPVFEWDRRSLYIRRPSSTARDSDPCAILDARVLLMLGDSVTTDHISPVGAIAPAGPAGRYLLERGVALDDLNTFGARRGNHEVMLRGTFDNPRLANRFLPGQLGNRALGPDGTTIRTVYETANEFARAGTETVICAGHAYGSGSARDWAAKGTAGLGVRAVIASSFERIHRTNLILCGVLPLVLPPEMDWGRANLSVHDEISLTPVGKLKPGGPVKMALRRACGPYEEIVVSCAIRTEQELELYLGGGVMSAFRSHLTNRAGTDRSVAAAMHLNPHRSRQA